VNQVAAQFAVAPSWALFHGHAHQAILDAVNLLAGTIVVLGAQGEREGASPLGTIGETAFKVAGRSRCATLLVRREVHEPYRRVIACAKGVPVDRAVIEWACRISSENLVHIVSAYTVPYEGRLVMWGASQSTIDVYATREREERVRLLSATLSELGIPAARVQLHVERGEPLQLILRNAAQLEADLLIVGRRAQTDPLGGGAFGSVARHVGLLAPMDVMIVPPELRS
jgi:nucleotide-binding universal stress UspA family protein